jgi:hypothetical protein
MKKKIMGVLLALSLLILHSQDAVACNHADDRGRNPDLEEILELAGPRPHGQPLRQRLDNIITARHRAEGNWYLWRRRITQMGGGVCGKYITAGGCVLVLSYLSYAIYKKLRK